jgi:hypothetical protein
VPTIFTLSTECVFLQRALAVQLLTATLRTRLP